MWTAAFMCGFLTAVVMIDPAVSRNRSLPIVQSQWPDCGALSSW